MIAGASRCPGKPALLIRAVRFVVGIAAIGALLGAVPSKANASEPACSGEFSADRPGLSTDTAVLSLDCQQLEGGYQYSRDDTGLSTATLPLLLYRIGVSDALELRASWDGEILSHDHQVVARSANDPSVGAKLRLRDGGGLALSLLGQFSLPVGSAAATSGEIDPSVALLWKQALSERTALSGAFTRAANSTGDGDRHWQSAVAVDLSRDLGHEFGAFVEWAASRQDGARDMQTLDGGVTWQVSPAMQLDINGGRSWQGIRQNFVGGGIAWRY